MTTKNLLIATSAIAALMLLLPGASAATVCVAVQCTQTTIDSHNVVNSYAYTCGGSGNIFIVTGNNNNVTVCDNSHDGHEVSAREAKKLFDADVPAVGLPDGFRLPPFLDY